MLTTKNPMKCGIGKWQDKGNLQIDGCKVEIKDPSECLFKSHGIYD